MRVVPQAVERERLWRDEIKQAARLQDAPDLTKTLRPIDDVFEHVVEHYKIKGRIGKRDFFSGGFAQIDLNAMILGPDLSALDAQIKRLDACAFRALLGERYEGASVTTPYVENDAPFI